MTPETFAQLFTPKGLQPFQPKAGDRGFTPLLEVHTPTEIQAYFLALDGFNDGPTRFGYLRELGRTCGLQGVVEAVRFGSEAWMRAFSEEEFLARKGRLVESYADKEEVIVVMGQMADGPGFMASARLLRRSTGTVASLGRWKVAPGPQHRSDLLEAFWKGYHQGRAAQEADYAG